MRSLLLCALLLACSCGDDDTGSTGNTGQGGAAGSQAAGSGGSQAAGSGGSQAAGAGGSLAAGSGGGGAGGAGAGCPSVSGTWTVKEHCQAPLVGSKIQISQDGCSFKDETFGFTGTVQADGSFTASGSPGGGPALTCTGKATATEISQTCEPGACAVVVTR